MEAICPATNTERLLLSSDRSEYSEGAIREAIKLAKRCGSTLTAMTVVERNDELEALAPKQVEKSEKEAREHIEAIQARAKKEGVDCTVTVRKAFEPYRVIVEEAEKQKSTMIIMGRRGRKGLARLVMGSSTARVIGHADCNVLVVPRAAQMEFTNILVATDGSKYSAAAASQAIGIAKRNNSALTVISVIPAEIAMPTDVDLSVVQRERIANQEMKEAEANARAVKEAAEKEGVAVRAYVRSGRPADALVETAKETKASMIVVGSHGRTGLAKLLIGSVAERTIVLAPCAVLVAKVKE